MKKVAIHGVPRSGTTWVGEIFNSSPNTRYLYQPLFSYALKGFFSEGVSPEQVRRFYEELAQQEDDFLLQKEARKNGLLPSFRKDEVTHVGYKEVRYHHLLKKLISARQGVVFVLVLRNPFGVIHSWLKAPREFRADLGWDPLEEWRHAEKKNRSLPEEYNGYERWKEATRLFVELEALHPESVICVHYEDLLSQPVTEAKRLYSFVELSWHDQVEELLCAAGKESRFTREGAYSVMKNYQADDRWVGQLDSRIVDEIREDLDGSDLQFMLREDHG